VNRITTTDKGLRILGAFGKHDSHERIKLIRKSGSFPILGHNLKGTEADEGEPEAREL
jgi:hypothetical protein